MLYFCDVVNENIGEYDFNYAYLKCESPQAPPSFFISGAFQTIDSWKLTGKYLSQYFDMILIDPPGFGDSGPVPPVPESKEIQMRAIIETANHLGIDKFNILGSSYGSQLITTFAQIYKDRLEKILIPGLILDIPIDSSQLTKKAINTTSPENYGEYIASAFQNEFKKSHISNYDLASRLLKRTIKKATPNQVENFKNTTLSLGDLDYSQKVYNRTLVFTGKFESFTPIDIEKMKLIFKNLDYREINHTDHLFFLNDIKGINKVLKNFIINE